MGGEGGGQTPEEIAREHARIQREIENRTRPTEGGLRPDDIAKIEKNQNKDDLDRLAGERPQTSAEPPDPDKVPAREFSGELDRQLDEAERALRDRGFRWEPSESIMDEIDHTQAATGVMGLGSDEAPVLTGGMLDALRRPGNQIRLAAVGLGLVGMLLLFWGSRAQLRNEVTQPPGGAVASPTAAAPSATAGATVSPTALASPITQLPLPVTGTATADASFIKVSGPCNLAVQFTDRYSFAASDGALTLTQLSVGHVSTGTISPDGDFTTMAEGQGYSGRVSGTMAVGQHTYTAEGCDEIYDFTMTLSEPLLPAATIAPSPTTPTVPPATGTPVPAASPAPTAPASTATPGPAVATGGGGPNFPLLALGLALLAGAIGLFFGGPRLAGGPVIDRPPDGGDPCAKEKVRLAAAELARDAADERLRQIEELQRSAQVTKLEAAAKQQAAAEAAKGASSYTGSDGKPVYTNAQQRARIAAAQAGAAAARTAADAAQSAYDAAGGARGYQAAGDEAFRANREHGDAKASLDACLRLAAATAPTPPPRSSDDGTTTTGGTGVGIGTGASDGTRTRGEPPCTKGAKRNETTAEHRFFMHDVGSAEIVTESFKAETDDSHARRLLEHLGTVDGAFKGGKIARGLAGGEIVGPILDAIDFPDFLTYFGKMREKLDETMKGLLEQLRQSRRRGEYTIRFTTHHFLMTCRTWEECDGEQFIRHSEIDLSLLRSVPASLGPEVLTDEESRRRWLDGWLLHALPRHNNDAQRRADEFRQGCGH